MRTYIKLLTGTLLFLTLLFSGVVSAQTVAQSKLTCANSHCTSKDLSVVDVFVDVPACTTCSGGTVTAPLKMTIHNGTKSERTSFALYGTLSAGATINGISGKIFICVGAITVKQGDQTFTVGTISFSCGQDLTLTNNLLAWTDASGTTADRCNTFSQATQCKDLEPKCGEAPSITIRQPLSAQSSATQSCDNSATGSVTVTPHGGKAPYDITIDGTTTNNVLTATKSPLGGGSHSWSVTDDAGCTTSGTQTVGTIACCVAPPKPTVCETAATLCGDGTASLTVTNAVEGDVYHLKQGGVEVSGSPKTADASGEVTFTGLTPGGKFDVWGVDTKNGTSCEGEHANCDNTTPGTCSASLTSSSSSQIIQQNIKLQAPPTNKVLAVPNPFNDRIRFTLQSDVSGHGALELYNVTGQRVKTVYQGYIQKGQTQTIDYSVPVNQRTNLFYIFRVGDLKATGKLVGLKK